MHAHALLLTSCLIPLHIILVLLVPFSPLPFVISLGFFICISSLLFLFHSFCGCFTCHIDFPFVQDSLREDPGVNFYFCHSQTGRANLGPKPQYGHNCDPSKVQQENSKATEALITFSQIYCVQHSHRIINRAHVSFLKSSIERPGYAYTSTLIAFTVPGGSSTKYESQKAPRKGPPPKRTLKTLSKTLLIDGHHRCFALQNLAAKNRWNADNLVRVSSEFRKNRIALMSRELVFYSSLANKTSTIALTDRRFVVHVQSMLASTSTFKGNCVSRFSETRTAEKTRELQNSEFISGTSLQTCRRRSCIARYMIEFPAVLRYIKEEAWEPPQSQGFEWQHISYIQRNGTCVAPAGGPRIFLQWEEIKWWLPPQLFFFAAGRYFGKLNTLFEVIQQRPGFSCLEKSFNDYQRTQLAPAISLKTKVRAILLTWMNLFVCGTRQRKQMYGRLCRRGQTQKVAVVSSAFITKDRYSKRTSGRNTSRYFFNNSVPTSDAISTSGANNKILAVMEPAAPPFFQKSRVRKVFLFLR